MGERGPADAPPAASRGPRPSPALLVLLAALLGLLVLALLPRPLDRDEAGALLLAGSLAGEGDRVVGQADRERAAALRADGAEGADAPRPRHGEILPGSLLHGLWLVPWTALGGARLALAAQWALLAGAALLAGLVMVRRIGRGAGWLPLLLIFGSATFALALRLWAEPFLFSLVLLAFALAEWRAAPRLDPAASGELPDVYPEELSPEGPQRPARVGLRWSGVGLLLGAVGSAAPWTLPLLWPAAVRIPAMHRRAGRAALLGGAALALAALVAGTAATGDGGLGSLGESALAGVESLVGGLSPAASAWDLVYAVAGRHIGVLFTFAPLLLLLALGGATRDALPLCGAALLGLVLLALLRPFDLGGSELALGLRTFLPFFAALWMLPARPARPAELLAAAALAGAFIWPLWAAPLEPWGEGGTPRWVPRYLAPWTPVETTQVRLPLGARVPFGGGEALLLPGEALGRGSVARVPTGGWVEVVIGVPDELVGAWIEAGEQASSELPVRGGELTELMFRPDGGIAFLVRPKRAWIRHGLPGRAGTWSFYRLGVRFPAPEGREFTIRVRPG